MNDLLITRNKILNMCFFRQLQLRLFLKGVKEMNECLIQVSISMMNKKKHIFFFNESTFSIQTTIPKLTSSLKSSILRRNNMGNDNSLIKGKY